MLPVAGLLAGRRPDRGDLFPHRPRAQDLQPHHVPELRLHNPALFLALLASMIVGLSLPITATYIMTVVMVAPALVKVGVPDHVAHMLAFYFAVLSEVSPARRVSLPRPLPRSPAGIPSGP